MRPEEKVSSDLLEQFLRQSVDPSARCGEGADPPDICCVAGGERLAVEVTRVDQQLNAGGKTKARSERDEPLMKFGQELGTVTRGVRERKYLLILYGLSKGESWHRWKGNVTKLVVEFVRSNQLGSMSFPGGELSAFDDGNSWLVTIGIPQDANLPGGRPLFDIAAGIVEMLRHVLEAKVSTLASLGGYDRRVLLLLNHYFFGGDIAEIERVLIQLIQQNSAFEIFDLVFYENDSRLHLVYEKPRQ